MDHLDSQLSTSGKASWYVTDRIAYSLEMPGQVHLSSMFASDTWKGSEVYRLLDLIHQESKNASAILGSLPFGIAVLDAEGELIEANQNHAANFGDETLRSTPALRQIISEVLSDKQPRTNVPLGLKRPMRTVLQPYRGDSVLLISEPLLSRDVDLRLEFLHAIDTPAYIATDRHGIVAANAAFAAITQLDRDALVGLRPSDLHGPDFSRWLFHDGVRRTVIKTRGGETMPVTVNIKTVHGQPSPTSIVAVQTAHSEMPVVSPDVMGVLERVMGRLAHEFNNALMIVLMGADSLSSNFGSVPAVRTDMEYITQAARRAATISHDLLMFSRGRQGQTTGLVQPDDAIRSMECLLGTLVPNRELHIKTDAPTSQVRLASNDLETVLTKLVQNAAESTDEGGRIEIETSKLTPDYKLQRSLLDGYGLKPIAHTRIRVTDDGRGIPADNLSKIFEPFFTTKPGAPGLGLSVVYGIVKRAEGLVLVDSEVGKGTTFTLLIPEVLA